MNAKESLKTTVLRLSKPFRKVLPESTRGRLDAGLERQNASKILKNLFAGRKVIPDLAGTWRVSPMPTENELSAYYQINYWSVRGDSKILLKSRDINHFEILRQYFPPRKSGLLGRALNFGSGRGGVSYLLMVSGFEVVNVDPFDPRIPNCQHVERLEDVDGEFDLIYSSHSLEHVTQLERTMTRLEELLAADGLFFVEVPNCLDSSQSVELHGERIPVMSPPHTYYISMDFFKSIQLKPILTDSLGPVIRYLGRKSHVSVR